MSKESRKSSHLLVGDPIFREVNLGKDLDDWKDVRCLPDAAASRDKRHIFKIIKNASKDCDEDIVVYLATNDLFKKVVLSVQKDFQNVGQEPNRID